MLPTVIIREQEKKEVVKRLAYLLGRLGMLYQIPNFGAQNAVFLSEWILDNYGCEELITIESVLRNPPQDDEKNWRLTPDTITKWMTKKLELVAESREVELAKFKETHMGVLPNIDYDEFKKRITLEGMPESKPTGWDTPEYSKVKVDYMQKKVLENKPTAE